MTIRVIHTDDGRSDRHADRVQIAGKTCHQVTGFVLVVIFHIHFFQMGKHVVSQLFFDGAGSSKQEVPPEETADRKQQSKQKQVKQI